jgi:formate--tetrahydrofolate ligase
VKVEDVGRENSTALSAGLANLERHIDNVHGVFGIPCVVAINHRGEDSPAEIELLQRSAARKGVKVILARHFADGGKGAADLAREVVDLCGQPGDFKFAYDDAQSLWDKMRSIAQKIYHAGDITASKSVRAQIQKLEDSGYGHFPVCVAKTQYSFATDPALRGAPEGHTVNVREVRLAAGAQFVVMICGDIMTMPGLPRVPAAAAIDIDEDGKTVGLF